MLFDVFRITPNAAKEGDRTALLDHRRRERAGRR